MANWISSHVINEISLEITITEIFSVMPQAEVDEKN